MSDEFEPVEEKRQYQHYVDLENKLEKHYQSLNTELDEHAQFLDNKLRSFFLKAMIGFAVMGVTCAISILGFGIVLDNQSETTTKIQEQSDKLQDQANKIHDQAIRIQKQRYAATLQTCQDQNHRHRDVVKEIDKAVAQVPPDQKVEAQQGAKTFKLIIGASVPKRHCKQRADRLVKGIIGAKQSDDK